MKPDPWQKLDRLFNSALGLEPGERAALLDKECAGNAGLRDEVEALLAAHGEAGSFIERPAIDVEARSIAKDGQQVIAGQTIGHYRIISQLGVGGMGEVYLAEDRALGRKVALKLLPADFTRDIERVRRFQQEAHAASALNHPNIVTIHEIAHIDDRHLIATEFVDGETLRERIRGSASQTSEDGSEKAGTAVSIREVLNIGIQIADALAAAHEAGIVHRDIKPENIMVRRRDGYIKVLDFGLAKPTSSAVGGYDVDAEATTRPQVKTSAGMVMGTVTYMSPEQTRGEQVDARTDIWSLGVVLYELVAGRAPFDRPTPSEIIAAILDREPPPLTNYVRAIPSEFERIVSKALTKTREERYQTVNDLLIDLRRFQQHLQTEAVIGLYARRAPSPNPVQSATGGERLVSEMKDDSGATSIAVLPFVNMSTDAENEFFCDGLAEELLNALTKIGEIKVAARSSAFSFKNKNSSVSEIGVALGVNKVLEGSVRKSGDRLRISVQLINASDGYHLWSERYDRSMRDIFDLQDEITIAVVDALKVKLLGDEKAALFKRHTDNPQAYELYLKARHFWNRRTAEGFTKAIEQFQHAIDIDPNYALAYAGLADCYSVMQVYASAPQSEMLPKAKAAAIRALQLDDSLAEAHASLGWIHSLSWRWRDAEDQFKRAIQLNPNYPIAHVWYSIWLNIMGRLDEAMREVERAEELDPLLPALAGNLPRIQILKGDLEAAIAFCNNAVELDPTYHYVHVILAVAYQKQGRYEEAIAEARKGVELSRRSSGYLAPLGYCYAVADRRSEALEILKELEKKHTRGESPGACLAWVHAGLGDKDQAFAWLEKDLQDRSGQLPFLITGWPMLDTLRSDARYADLLRRLGLPADVRDTIPESGEPQATERSPKALTTTISAEDSPVTRRRRSLVMVAVASAVVVLVAAALIYKSYLSARPKAIDSIAVLPLINASNDPNTEYLSDGISEALINSLSELQQLRVPARTTTFRYKGKDVDPQALGRELDVRAVLMGRVRQFGDTLSIQVDLVDTATGAQLWGREYERKVSDLLPVKQLIAREVTEKLRLGLSGEQQQKLNKGDTTNAEAYEFYLRGRYYWNKRTVDDLSKAIEQFQQAIDKDPNYARAYVGLTDSYTTHALYANIPTTEMLPRAREAVERALQIDDSLAEAHASLGQIERDSWNYFEAEKEYKRAIELNPRYATAHHFYSLFLRAWRGRFDEAMVEIKLAHQLEPLSLIIGSNLVASYVSKGELEEAIEAAKRVIELDPTFPEAHRQLCLAFRRQGRYNESIAEGEKAVQLSKRYGWALAALGVSYAVSGNKDKAREILKELEERYAQHTALGQQIAYVCAVLGQKDQAFAWLEKDYQARSGSLPFIAYAEENTLRDALRGDPRWSDLLRRMGLQN